MQTAAMRAKEWINDGHADGLTDTGKLRMRQLINRDELSEREVLKMYSYFARHQVDKDAEGFFQGQDGFPSKGRIAWDAWGGDAGVTWSRKYRNIIMRNREEIKKSFSIQDAKFYDNEENNLGEVEGYVSTFGNVDRQGDIILPDAFTESIQEIENGKNLPLLFNHNRDYLIGGFTELRQDKKGLYAKAKINLETQRGQEAYSHLKNGFLKEFSIAGKAMYDRNDRNIIKKWDLFEISVVTIPANPQALVTNVKNTNIDEDLDDMNDMKKATEFKDFPLANRDYRWDSDEAVKRVRDFLKLEGSPNDDYKNAFFWYDEYEADLFNAYKMPFLDVVDGELKAVPRAIFSAYAVMQGARGGVDIPNSERMDVEKHIQRYYQKMGIEREGKGLLPIEVDWIPHDEKINLFSEYFNVSKKLARIFAHGLTMHCDARKAGITDTELRDFTKKAIQDLIEKKEKDLQEKINAEKKQDMMRSLLMGLQGSLKNNE